MFKGGWRFIKRFSIMVVLYANWSYCAQVMVDTVSYADYIGQPVSPVSIVYLVIVTWITLMLAVLMAKEFAVEDWRWKRPNRRELKSLLIYAAIFLSVVFALSGLFYVLDYRVLANQKEILKIQSMLPVPVFIIIVVLYAPIMEELIFRAGIMGYLFRNHPWLGGVVSTFLFTMTHLPTHPSAWMLYGSMGAMLAWIFYRSKRLDFVIYIHMANNALSILFPVAG